MVDKISWKKRVAGEKLRPALAKGKRDTRQGLCDDWFAEFDLDFLVFSVEFLSSPTCLQTSTLHRLSRLSTIVAATGVSATMPDLLG
jgi:hypothetical protein